MFLLAESTQHISPIEQPIMQPIQHMRGRVLLCVLQLAYIFIALDAHTHAWRNFHWGQGGHVPRSFLNPVCVPPTLQICLLLFFNASRHRHGGTHSLCERARRRERAREGGRERERGGERERERERGREHTFIYLI